MSYSTIGLIMVLMFVGGLFTGAVLVGISVLWTRGARGFIRDRMGVTEVLETMGRFMQKVSDKSDLNEANIGTVSMKAKGTYDALEAVVQELNHAIGAIKNTNGLIAAWCADDPRMRRVKDEFVRKQKMTIAPKPEGREFNETGEVKKPEEARCGDCGLPKASHEVFAGANTSYAQQSKGCAGWVTE